MIEVDYNSKESNWNKSVVNCLRLKVIYQIATIGAAVVVGIFLPPWNFFTEYYFEWNDFRVTNCSYGDDWIARKNLNVSNHSLKKNCHRSYNELPEILNKKGILFYQL